jgi:hypothetical protein
VIDGAIGVAGVAGDAIDHATKLCSDEVWWTDETTNVVAWLSTSDDDAKSRIARVNPTDGPVSDTNGNVVAQSVADLANCTKGQSGTDCLLGPIMHTVDGNEFINPTWTGTLPDGTADSPNCNDWTSNSANDHGSGGFALDVDAGWTTTGDPPGTCDQLRRLLCFYFQSSG